MPNRQSPGSGGSGTLKKQSRVYPELVRSRRFWGYALCIAFSTGGFYAFLGGAPLVASTLFDVPPALLGVYMGSITAGFVSGSFLSGRFAARYALTTMMIGGRIVACLGLILGLLVLAAGVLHELTLFGACVCVGIGNGITMPSSSSGALSVRPTLAGRASGLSGALTVAGGGDFGGHRGHLDGAKCGLGVTRNDALVFGFGFGDRTLCALARPIENTADLIEPLTGYN